MKKLLLIALFVCSAFSAMADEPNYFFAEKVIVSDLPAGPTEWHVFGTLPTGNTTDLVCRASITYDDGSIFTIGRYMSQNVVYMYVHNIAWNVAPPKEGFPFMDVAEFAVYKDRRNEPKGSHPIGSGKWTFGMADKNSIVIDGIEPNDMYNILAKSNGMRLVMPGTINNVYINGYGIMIARRMAACFARAASLMNAKAQSSFKSPKKDDGGI